MIPKDYLQSAEAQASIDEACAGHAVLPTDSDKKKLLLPSLEQGPVESEEEPPAKEQEGEEKEPEQEPPTDSRPSS